MSDLKELAKEIREINGLNGWNLWQREHFETEPYKFGAVCALIHSEVSEALEWNRQMGKTGFIINDKIMTQQDILANILGLSHNSTDREIRCIESNFYNLTSQLEKIKSDDQIIDKIKEEMADVLIRVLDWWSAYDDDPMDTIKAKLPKIDYVVKDMVAKYYEE